MYIGIFDQDMLLRPNMFDPSLELMKYASYYKRDGHIVKMVYDANKIAPFDKIILSNDNVKLSKKDMPKMMMLNPKVEWIGRGFNKGKIILPPQEIQECRPDPTIYLPYLDLNKEKFRGKQRKRLRKILLSADLARLTTQGKCIGKYEKTHECLVLYDLDFFTCPEALDILRENKDRLVFFLYNQGIDDLELFKTVHDNFSNIRQLHINRGFDYTGPLNKKDFLFLYHEGYLKTPFCLGFPSTDPLRADYYFLKKELISKGNFFLYSIAQKNKILLTQSSNFAVEESSELLVVVSELCRFTRMYNYKDDITFKQYLNSRGKRTKGEIHRLEQDMALKRIFNANLKQISEVGIWRI